MDTKITITLITTPQAAKIYEEMDDIEREQIIKLVEDELYKVSIKHLVAQGKDVEARGWPPGYFENTFGALRAMELERPPQGEYEKREDFD